MISSASAESISYWSSKITVTGEYHETASYTDDVIIGSADADTTQEGPPNPLEYSVELILYSSDFSNSYCKDIRQFNPEGQLWYFRVDPHGNVNPPVPPLTVQLSWNPSEFSSCGTFRLVDMGYNAAEYNPVIEDMRTENSYSVTGPELHYFGIEYTLDQDNYLCGDFDCNGLVNVIDIMLFIFYKFKDEQPPAKIGACDVDGCDGSVNILDILYLIDYKFRDGPEPICCNER